MDFNQKRSENWKTTTESWRETQKCLTITLPDGRKVKFTGQLGDCCKFHRWQLFGDILRPENRGKILSSPEMEKFIEANKSKRGPDGSFVVSTARGKRRVAKKEGKR